MKGKTKSNYWDSHYMGFDLKSSNFLCRPIFFEPLHRNRNTRIGNIDFFQSVFNILAGLPV